MSRFLIPLSEYNRIYQVTHGVSQTFGGAEKGCIFFACCGALILNKHYKIKASAVAGAFALCVNDTPEVAFFGENQGGRIKLSVPRKMLQRSMSSEASSLDAVNTPGDFYTIPDLELTNVLLDKFLDRPAMRDLLNIVDTWHGARRKPQLPSITMGDSAGHADARAPLGTAQPVGKTPPEADTFDDASLNKRMFADRDLSPRISQNITDALMSRVILPGLAALPTHENIPKQGAASQEQFLEWSAMHFDNATAGEARRAFALTLAATFERHLRRWMFRHKTPKAGKMTFDALLAA
ncbi:hypothetical protein LTR94_027437, partial [Friedmanniomyces endolithicus]